MSIEALPFVNWIFWGALSGGTLLAVGMTEWLGGTTRGYRLFMAVAVLVAALIWLASEMGLVPVAGVEVHVLLAGGVPDDGPRRSADDGGLAHGRALLQVRHSSPELQFTPPGSGPSLGKACRGGATVLPGERAGAGDAP